LKSPKSFKPKRGTGNSFNARKKRDILYDSVWNHYRIVFLKINPRCYACGARATVVDHLVAHKGDKELFTKVDNHIPLCKHDHDTITAKFDRVEPPNYQGKLEYLAKRRVQTSTTITVKVLPHYGSRPKI